MNKVLIGVVILVIIAAGAFALLNKGDSNQQQSQDVNPTTTQQTSPVEEKKSETTITLTSSGFEPKTLTIKAGTKVVWTNKSGGTATVNSAPHPQHTDFPPLNLGEFGDGQSLELVFEKPGTYKYHNHLNASQFGQVIVE